MKKNYKGFDVKGAMKDAQELRVLERQIRVYTDLIKMETDIPKLREYIAKKSAFEKKAEKIKSRLNAIYI